MALPVVKRSVCPSFKLSKSEVYWPNINQSVPSPPSSLSNDNVLKLGLSSVPSPTTPISIMSLPAPKSIQSEFSGVYVWMKSSPPLVSKIMLPPTPSPISWWRGLLPLRCVLIDSESDSSEPRKIVSSLPYVGFIVLPNKCCKYPPLSSTEKKLPTFAPSTRTDCSTNNCLEPPRLLVGSSDEGSP